MSEQPQPPNKTRRPTEPIPSSFKPLWMLMLFLGVIVVVAAVASYVIDRAIYVW